MDCLTMEVLPKSKSFGEKMQAYSCIKSGASCCISGSQPSIPDRSIFCKMSSVSSCQTPSDNLTWADIHCTFLFSLKSCSSGICIDGTMLAVVTVTTSVCGSRVTSLPDKFLSTPATPDLLGINSEVLAGMNILFHLGDGSTNTWTCFWCPVTFVSPFAITVWKAGIFTFLVVTTLPFTWSKSNS